MVSPISRRHAIRISAAAAGLALVPWSRATEVENDAVTWRGQALGAPASLLINHHDRGLALRLVEKVATEIRRLERVFSLYQEDSDLVRLNRRRSIAAPPQEMVELLEKCRTFWELTRGAFDPTVQPLWALYKAHFSDRGADPGGPSAGLIQDVLGNIGFGSVLLGRDRIGFARRGMALTLNGVAQGFITDRIVDLLRAGGIDRSLVDIGESRAIGPRQDGGGWRVGIADPERSDRRLAVLEIVDRAVATSSPYGFQFDRKGQFNHLLDPRSGQSAHRYKSVTVVAPTAVDADALSTAFSLMESVDIAELAKVVGGVDVYLVPFSGSHIALHS